MSFEAYRGLTVHTPYILRLTDPGSGGEAIYFGTDHLRDPAHPVLLEIEGLLRDFNMDEGVDLVLNEGGRPEPNLPRDEMVRRHGEAGLLVWLADQLDLAYDTFEPPRVVEAEALSAELGADRVALFYFLRDFESFKGGGFAESPEQYARVVLDNLHAARITWAPRTLAECRALIARELPDLTVWSAMPWSWIDPGQDGHGWLTTLSRASSRFRDEHIARRLLSSVGRGRRVFAVIGFTHLVMQEPLLSALLNVECLGGRIAPR